MKTKLLQALLIFTIPFVLYAEDYSYQPYTASHETIPDEFTFNVDTHGTKGQVADTIAYGVFREFLYQNNYSFYNVVSKPVNYRPRFNRYVVHFYRHSKIAY